MKQRLFLTLLTFALVATAEPLVLTSPAERVPLLELYTSEGCSSCPPADAWFSGLVGRKKLWDRLVPVAFHVTYWDRLGWKDPFGLKTADLRQYGYAEAWSARNVYTPEFVLAGSEWRGWRRGADPAANDSVKAGILTARVDGDRVEVTYAAADGKPRVYEAHLAVLAFGQTIAVKAGENAGRMLTHDFVVHRLLAADLLRPGKPVAVQLPEGWRPAGKRAAIAVWVNAAGDPTPVQAVGGWLPEAAP